LLNFIFVTFKKILSIKPYDKEICNLSEIEHFWRTITTHTPR